MRRLVDLFGGARCPCAEQPCHSGLVVWKRLEHEVSIILSSFIDDHILGMIIPTDLTNIFQMGGYTTNQREV